MIARMLILSLLEHCALFGYTMQEANLLDNYDIHVYTNIIHFQCIYTHSHVRKPALAFMIL